ncbi:MAG: hypothetical protein WA129_14200 [Acidovorax sp.]
MAQGAQAGPALVVAGDAGACGIALAWRQPWRAARPEIMNML